MVNNSAQLSRLFFALSDPSRMAMIERLGSGVASVSELARPLDMSMAAVVQHVRVLVESGLIRTEKKGRVRSCQLNPDALEAVSAWIAGRQAEFWKAGLQAVEDSLHERTPPKTRNNRR